MGNTCDRCAVEHFNFPSCQPCECNDQGSKNNICNPQSGDCDCREEKFDGKKCDRCKDDFFGFPVCQPCGCDLIGTQKGTSCSKDAGKCACKIGYAGDKCDQCDQGYHKSPEGTCIGTRNLLF